MSNLRRKIGPLTVDIPVIFIGLQILAKGWAKLEDFGHHPFVASVLLFLGSIVLVGAFLTLWLEKKTESAHAIFHVVEGLAVTLSAIVLLEKGKLRIPLLLLFTGLCYVVVGFVQSRAPERRAALTGLMQTAFGWAFLAAGLLLAGLTTVGDHSVWAFGSSGLLVSIGTAFLVYRLKMARARASAAPMMREPEVGSG